MKRMPLLAWREWFVINNALVGFHNGRWDSKEFIADCSNKLPPVNFISDLEAGTYHPDGEMSPCASCWCGIHGLKSPPHYRPDMLGIKTKIVLTVGVIMLMLGMMALLFARPNVFLALGLAGTLGGVVYGASRLNPKYSVPMIMGIIALSGKILVYNEGMRAQKAVIIALVKNSSVDQYLTEYLQDKYEVPIFATIKEASRYAREWGEEIK